MPSIVIPTLAQVSSQTIERLRALEQELGNAYVLACSLQHVAPASLTQQQVSRLQQLEQELGLTLIAVAKQ